MVTARTTTSERGRNDRQSAPTRRGSRRAGGRHRHDVIPPARVWDQGGGHARQPRPRPRPPRPSEPDTFEPATTSCSCVRPRLRPTRVASPAYRKTAASGDEPFEASAPSVRRYSRHLVARQDAVAKRLGVTVEQRYTVAFDGFSAHLSAHQALALSKSPAVLAVRKDARWHSAGHPVAVGPYATSDLLGLTRHGRPFRGWHPATAGKGVVIGVIDTGYWPESKSFAGASLRKGGSVSPQHPGPIWLGSTHHTRFLKADGTTFRGTCQGGQRFPASTCNAKVISARFYDTGYRGSVPRSEWATYEFASPRDGGGHGSHTASTAAGDFGVQTTLYAAHDGAITGVAPAAKLRDLQGALVRSRHLARRRCVTPTSSPRSIRPCRTASTSSTSPSPAARRTASTTRCRSRSSTPRAQACSSPLPPATTVPARRPWATSDRGSPRWRPAPGRTRTAPYDSGNGAKFRGQTLNALGVRGRLVYGGDIARAPSGSDGATAAQCGTHTLQARQVQGAIVLCDRGGNYFYQKAGEVYAKGGAGLIIGNAAKGKLFADPLYLPAVHVGFHFAQPDPALHQEGRTARPRETPRRQPNGSATDPDPADRRVLVARSHHGQWRRHPQARRRRTRRPRARSRRPAVGLRPEVPVLRRHIDGSPAHRRPRRVRPRPAPAADAGRHPLGHGHLRTRHP